MTCSSLQSTYHMQICTYISLYGYIGNVQSTLIYILSLIWTWFLKNQFEKKNPVWIYFELDFYCLCNFEIDFCRLKIQFVELDFYNLIFQKSSTDQQGVREIIYRSCSKRQHWFTNIWPSSRRHIFTKNTLFL